MSETKTFPRGFSVGEYRGPCPRCHKALVQGNTGARHQTGYSECTLSQEIAFWAKDLGKVVGWGIALIFGFLLVVGFLSTFAAPIISNSN